MATSKYAVYYRDKFIGHYPGNNPKIAIKKAFKKNDLEHTNPTDVYSAYKTHGHDRTARSFTVAECLEV